MFISFFGVMPYKTVLSGACLQQLPSLNSSSAHHVSIKTGGASWGEVLRGMPCTWYLQRPGEPLQPPSLVHQRGVTGGVVLSSGSLFNALALVMFLPRRSARVLRLVTGPVTARSTAASSSATVLRHSRRSGRAKVPSGRPPCSASSCPPT